MAVDYKHKPKRTPAKKQKPAGRFRGVLVFVVGLTLGLGGAFAALLIYQNISSTKEASSSSASSPATAVKPTKPSKASKSSESSESKQAPTTETSEPATDTIERPRFEFYTILPETEVMVPDAEVATPKPAVVPTKVAGQPTQATQPAQPNQPNQPAQAVQSAQPNQPTQIAPITKLDASPGEYILQAGSFRQYADADRHKASIALLGIVASIQSVVIKQGEQWYRVQIGPVDSMAELNRIRTLLADNNIKFLVIRNTPQRK